MPHMHRNRLFHVTVKQASRLKQMVSFSHKFLFSLGLKLIYINFSCLAMQRASPLVGLCVRNQSYPVSLNSLNAVTMLGLYDSWNL